MPIDASIPLSYKPIDGMANLSSLLDTRKKMLELNKSTDTYDSDVAKAKAESSTAQSGAATASINLGEKKALQQLDISKHMENGKINFNTLIPEASKIAPTTYMDYVGNAAQAQAKSTGADKAINDLEAQQKNQLSNYAYSMLDKSDSQIRQGFDLLGKEMPSLAPHLPHLQNSLDRARQNGGQPAVNAMISQFARSTVGTPEQQVMNTPNTTYVQTQAGTLPVNNKPDSASPMGATGPALTPPNVAVTNNAGGTGFANPATAKYSDVTGPDNSTPLTLPPNESKGSREASLALRPQANDAASNAPSQAFNANQIIKYADAAFTGTGKDKLAQAAAIFPGVKFTGEKATDTQLLGHAIAQQTTTLANQAGLAGSNAKLALSEQMTADGKWTPEAIKSSSRVMRAIGDSGAILYNKGMENAAKSGDPFAFREFRNNWSEAASAGGIDGIRLYDARRHASADPDGMKQTVKSMGGVDSDRYKQALKSMDRLGKLVRGE